MSQKLATPEPQNPPPRPTASSPNARRAAAPPPERRHRKSNAELVHEGEDENFLSSHRKKLIVGVVLVLALGAYLMPKPGPSAPVRKVEKIVSVTIPPPPPKIQPPPPPKVQPPPEKMEKQAAVEDKPKDVPKKADNPPPAALATGIKGDGPGSGLAGSGNGLGGGSAIGGTGGGGLGGRWDRYAAKVQSKIADALRTNSKTRSASIAGLKVRIKPDATGRIGEVTLVNSTGNTELDRVIQKEILTGLDLTEGPPAGMRLPITLRLTAARR